MASGVEIFFFLPVFLIGLAIPIATLVLLIFIFIKVSKIEKALQNRGIL